MKQKVYFLLILSLLIKYSSSQKIMKCYSMDSDYFIKEASEFIDMGGISSNSPQEFATGNVRFLAWDNKKPRTRYSKHEFISAKVKLDLRSNDDTGKDEIRIYSNSTMLFNYHFSDDFLEIKLKPSQISKLKFVVLNSKIKNQTAGAFEARIWIDGKVFVKKNEKKVVYGFKGFRERKLCF